MDQYQRLLLENKAWAEEKREQDPHYFEKEQNESPQFLYIGCSDSRVPATEITNTKPGELFVHRNIGNLVPNTDFNLLAILHYAVFELAVDHIIVCGHYGCSGVQAAISDKDMGLANKWLRNVKDTYRFYQDKLNAIEDQQQRFDKLVEFNVEEQVVNLAKTSIIQKAWKNKKSPVLHGWVFDQKTGLVKELNTLTADYELDTIYRYNLD